MSVASRVVVCGAFYLTLVARVCAQEHVHGGAPGEGLGRVAFATSCRPDAQIRFERAMALLHSFWWEEGARAFRAVAVADSTCALAYWGLALNSWGNPFAGGPSGENLRQGALAAARALTLGAPTARERGFLAAVRALYRDYEATSNSRRLLAYSDTLARVYRDFPDDPEVAIYYALSLVATASPTDTTFGRQRQAAAGRRPRSSIRCSVASRSTRDSRTTSSTPTTLPSSPRSASRPPVATRRSRPPRPMRSICRRTSSCGSGFGMRRSLPTSDRSTPASHTRERSTSGGSCRSSSTRSTTWSTAICRRGGTRRRGRPSRRAWRFQR